MLNMSNDINRTSTNAARMICTKCRNIYEKLKSYMRSIHIEGSAEKRWCADMVYGVGIWLQYIVNNLAIVFLHLTACKSSEIGLVTMQSLPMFMIFKLRISSSIP